MKRIKSLFPLRGAFMDVALAVIIGVSLATLLFLELSK